MDWLKERQQLPRFDGRRGLREYMDLVVNALEHMYDTLVMRLNSCVGYTASVVWNPANILDGDCVAQDVTCRGAQVGDFAVASFSVDLTDLVLDAQVTAADTVTCVLANNTGGGVNLGSGTLRVRVWPK